MTAVEWLVEQLKEYDFADIKDNENYIIKIPAWVLAEKEEQAKQMEKDQTEISDEEILKESNRIHGVSSIAFEEGAKWYREQIKSKQ
jgi:hypothetical protein